MKHEELKREGVRLLMQTVFNDREEALDIFFSRVYTTAGNYCRIKDGRSLTRLNLSAREFPMMAGVVITRLLMVLL